MPCLAGPTSGDNNMTYDDDDDHWRIEKKIPIGTIIILLAYAAMSLWWARGIQADVESLKENKIALADALRLDRLSSAEVRDLVIRIEGKVSSISDHLDKWNVTPRGR
jgi:hypothetical protein